jgi:ribosomal protein S27AE
MPYGYSLRRLRRCPDCGASHPASALGWVTSSALDPGQRQYRECPACGFIAPLAAFPIAERPELDQVRQFE